MMNRRSFASLLHFIILLHWKTDLLINAEFLAGCHYNEEEISQHIEKKCQILAGPNEWQQVCNLKKPVEVVKGRILAG